MCYYCSGWGHYAVDNHPKKSGLLSHNRTKCKTGEFIDICIAFYGVDQNLYKAAVGIVRQPVEWGFEPASEEHPYERHGFKPKNRATRLKTYKEEYRRRVGLLDEPLQP